MKRKRSGGQRNTRYLKSRRTGDVSARVGVWSSNFLKQFHGEGEDQEQDDEDDLDDPVSRNNVEVRHDDDGGIGEGGGYIGDGIGPRTSVTETQSIHPRVSNQTQHVVNHVQPSRTIPSEYDRYRNDEFDNIFLSVDSSFVEEVLHKERGRKRMFEYLRGCHNYWNLLEEILTKSRTSKCLLDLRNPGNKKLFLLVESDRVKVTPPFVPLFTKSFFDNLSRSLTLYELFWISKDNLNLAILCDIHVDCFRFSEDEWKSFFKSDICFTWPRYEDFFDFKSDCGTMFDSFDASQKNFYISQIIRYATSNLTKADIQANISYEQSRWTSPKKFPSFKTVHDTVVQKLGISVIPYCGNCHAYFTIRYDYWKRKVSLLKGTPDTKCHNCGEDMYEVLSDGHHPKNFIPYFNQKNQQKCFMEIPSYRKKVHAFSRSFLRNPMKTKIFQSVQGKKFYRRCSEIIEKNDLVNENNLLVFPLIHSFDGVRMKNVRSESNFTTMKDLFDEVGSVEKNPFLRVVCDQYTTKIVNHGLINLIILRDLQAHEFYSSEAKFHFSRLLISCNDGKAANEISHTNLSGEYRCPNGECSGRKVTTDKGGTSFLFDKLGRRRSLRNCIVKVGGKYINGYKNMPVWVLIHEEFDCYANSICDMFHNIPNVGEKLVYLIPRPVLRIIDGNIIKKSKNSNWTEMSRGIEPLGPLKSKVMKGWKNMKFVQKIHAMKFYIFPMLSIITIPPNAKHESKKRYFLLRYFFQEFYFYMKAVEKYDGNNSNFEQNLYKRIDILKTLFRILLPQTFPISLHRLLEELVISIKKNSNHPGTCEFEDSYGQTKGDLGDITRSISMIAFTKIYLKKWITFIVSQIPKNNHTLRKFLRKQKDIITFSEDMENHEEEEDGSDNDWSKDGKCIGCSSKRFDYLDSGNSVSPDSLSNEAKSFISRRVSVVGNVTIHQHFRLRMKHKFFTKNYSLRRKTIRRENYHVLYVDCLGEKCIGEVVAVYSVQKDGKELLSMCDIRKRKILGYVLRRRYKISRSGSTTNVKEMEERFNTIENMKIVNADVSSESEFVPLESVKKKVLLLKCSGYDFEFGSKDPDSTRLIRVRQNNIILCLEDFYDRREGEKGILD